MSAPKDPATSGVDAWLRTSCAWVDAGLAKALPAEDVEPRRLHEAMRYAVLGGGKRLRPAIVRGVCTALGGAEDDALVPAMALELVHTYSLVHDDLPCMDDDRLRRGRPTVHVAYDEATAVLTGDALLTLAFEQLADAGKHAAALAALLGRAAGSVGMVGGQVIDLSLEAGAAEPPLAAVEDLHRRKTAALFGAAASMGATVAGADAAACEAAESFGIALGCCFQATDDLLDATGDAATLGKTPGKDAALERPTLVAAVGLEEARTRAEALAQTARSAAEKLSLGPGEPVYDLVSFVLGRRA